LRQLILPTQPIGSIPRPAGLLDAIAARGDGEDPALAAQAIGGS